MGQCAEVPEAEAIRGVLAEEIGRVLGTPPAEIDGSGNLDEYGLDSVDAVITAGVLSDRLAIELPPELLIQHRSLDGIVAAVVQLAQPRAWVAEDGPVFLFAGWGGRDGRLARLSACCGDRVTTRMVLIGSWQGWLRERLRLEDLVARACDEIEASRPAGPLRLAGYSQGATLAFAVASALESRGRAVAWLGVFDAIIDAPQRGGAAMRTRPGGGGAGRAAVRIGAFLGGWAAGLRRRDREAGRLRARLAIELFRRLPRRRAVAVAWLLARAPYLLRGRGGIRVDNLLQMHVFSLLWDEWLPRAVPLREGGCRAVLFRSDDAEASDLGWGRYCKALTIVPVAGDHETMFGPEHIEALAAAFVAALEA